MPRECCKETYDKIAEDEPIFIIRGQDALAIKTVGTWIDLAQKDGVPEDKLKRAREHLHDIKIFQREHPERCKMPD